MKRIVKYVLLLTLLLSTGVTHAWIDRNGQTIPDSNDRKSDGKFAAWLLLVDDEAAFFRVWDTPTPVVNIETSNKVQRNKPIVLLVIFSGCKEDKEGKCSLSVDFNITQPDGLNYADIPHQPLWSNKKAPKEGNLVMGEAYLRIRVEPHEKLGKYIVKAIVNDLNNNKQLALSSSFISYDN